MNPNIYNRHIHTHVQSLVSIINFPTQDLSDICYHDIHTKLCQRS